MMFFNRRKKSAAGVEARSMGADVVTQHNFFDRFRLVGNVGISSISVNAESALSVPAIGDAVNFISGTIAGLPLRVYQNSDSGRTMVEGGLATLLGSAVNDECSSFQWRKHLFEQVLVHGRGLTYVERTADGRTVKNLWPLDPTQVVIERRAGRRRYKYSEPGREPIWYDAGDIIDIPFMLKEDGLNHRGPIAMNVDVIALAIAATRYGGRMFENGGVPPFLIKGPFQSGQAMERASEEVFQAVKDAAEKGRPALTIPANIDITQLGFDPEKMQMVETKRYLVEEIARIYHLPPTFLQDLSHGTYSNTEQQDLHFVKHTLKRWIEQFEQELNLKIFGRTSDDTYVELSVDSLLRGDFKTRMEGHATAIQNALRTPNECRSAENLPHLPGGDQLYIQGATVPLDAQAQFNHGLSEPTDEEPSNGD